MAETIKDGNFKGGLKNQLTFKNNIDGTSDFSTSALLASIVHLGVGALAGWGLRKAIKGKDSKGVFNGGFKKSQDVADVESAELRG